ncbi:lipase family protein [Nocardia huaxiensis]|uniref:lipase family protein n=1 Tax=Nocardia huaxiensis TaxID=2755382 RepID=UPI001E38DC8E|nr:lipase family protein [Nocardia huaxiensis]UFS97094.1 lipase family protein [Nocardia huaxiensis]
MRKSHLGACMVAAAMLVLPFATASAQPSVQVEPIPALTVPPEFDDFYKPAAGVVAAAEPGQILRARAVSPALFGFIHLNIDAWQLLYRTTDSHGEPVATVTTVLVPRGPAPEGGRKLLSYQIAEDSLPQYCAPSYLLQSGAIPANFVGGIEALIPLAAGVGQGWTVSIPDWEGPNLAFAASRLNAQATLDGIRAVERFTPAQLSGSSTPAALWGYSGGTVPSAFAAEIADSYAPELNIVGVAAGGVAGGTLPIALRHNNGGLYSGLITVAIEGLANEYPEMRKVLEDKLDPVGKMILGTKKLFCQSVNTVILPFFDYLAHFQGDPLQDPAVQHVLADVSLGQRVPSMPVYFYHAQYDEILPNVGTDQVIDGYCRGNAPSVTYVRELLAEHISGAVTSIPGAFYWLKDRLDGVPAVSGCTISNPVSAFTEPQTLQAILELVPLDVRALLGQAIGADR